MGATAVQPPIVPSPPIPPSPQPYVYDFQHLMRNCTSSSQFSSQMDCFLSTVKSKSKYQQYLVTFLHSQLQQYPNPLYTYYQLRLARSHFPHAKSNRWHTLYTQPRPDVAAAICHNRDMLMDPTQLLQCLLPLANPQRLLSLVVPVGEVRKHYTPYSLESEIKQFFVRVVQMLLSYEICSVSYAVLNALLHAGYALEGKEQLLRMKVMVLNHILYTQNKMSGEWRVMERMDVQETIHYFYQSCRVEDTPVLAEALDSNQFQSKAELRQYCYGERSALFTVLDIIGKEQIHVERGQYQYFLQKLLQNSTDVGRNKFMIVKICNLYYGEHSIDTLMDVAQILIHFNVVVRIKQIHQILTMNQFGGQFKQFCIDIIMELMSNYPKEGKIRLPNKEVLDLKQVNSMFILLQYLHKVLFSFVLTEKQTHRELILHLLKWNELQRVRTLLQMNRQLKNEQMGEIIQFIEQYLQNKQYIDQQYTKQLLKICDMVPYSNSPTATTYLFQYVLQLQKLGIVLKKEQRRNISLAHLYYICDKYPSAVDNVDFDDLYRLINYIRGCRSNPSTESGTSKENLILHSQTMDQFLRFKMHLINHYYSIKKPKLAVKELDSLIELNPPWLSTELTSLCSKDPQLLPITLQKVHRGSDLSILLRLQRQKPSIVSTIKSAFTHRNYVVLDTMANEELFRDFAADISFGCKGRINELFFVLLGNEAERAFHHALLTHIEVDVVEHCILEGMKRRVLSIRQALPALVKYVYGSREGVLVGYTVYRSMKIDDIMEVSIQQYRGQLMEVNNKLKKYIGIMKLYKSMNRSFEQLYITDQYQFLFSEQCRRELFEGVKGRCLSVEHTHYLRQLFPYCVEDIIDELNEGYVDAYVDKLVIWAEESSEVVEQLVRRLLRLKSLIQVLNKIKGISGEHMQILNSFAAVEVGYQFSGLVMVQFLRSRVREMKPITWVYEEYRQKVMKVRKVTNVFVLSKVMYFMHGMNEKIEKQILESYLEGINIQSMQ